MEPRFSGYLDKNGKKIFEGNKVRLGDNVIHEGVVVKCVFSESRKDFIYEFLTGDNKGKFTDMDDSWRTYEIID